MRLSYVILYTVCPFFHLVLSVVVVFFFFFQAEDGIRDLVRSRGLGDVYKRQVPDVADGVISPADGKVISITEVDEPEFLKGKAKPVSYTHLTLPTSDLV